MAAYPYIFGDVHNPFVFGWKDSGSSGPVFQAETTAYMNAVGIDSDSTVYFASTPQEKTGLQLWTGLDTFITTLKNGGCWDVWRSIHLPRWGSATANKWNVKNALDTDAAHRMQWFGGWSHNITGAKPNGVNAYALPFINPFTMFSMNGMAWSHYNRENRTGTNGGHGVMNSGSGLIRSYNHDRLASNLLYGAIGEEGAPPRAVTVSTTDTRGIYTFARTAANDFRVYSGSGQVGISTYANPGSLPNGNFAWGAIIRTTGDIIATTPNSIEMSIMALGGQLTPALEAVWRPAVLQLMTDWNLTAP